MHRCTKIDYYAADDAVDVGEHCNAYSVTCHTARRSEGQDAQRLSSYIVFSSCLIISRSETSMLSQRVCGPDVSETPASQARGNPHEELKVRYEGLGFCGVG